MKTLSLIAAIGGTAVTVAGLAAAQINLPLAAVALACFVVVVVDAIGAQA